MKTALAFLASLALAGCLHPVGTDADDAGLGLDAGARVDAGTSDASCGDPVVMARYSTCSATRDQAACEAAGGTWATGPFGEIFCSCPTSQGSCSCTSSAQCLSSCLAEMAGGMNGCEKLASGTCAPVNAVFGCWCRFEEAPPAMAICID